MRDYGSPVLTWASLSGSPSPASALAGLEGRERGLGGEGFFARSPGIAHPFPQRFYGIPTTEQFLPSSLMAWYAVDTPVQRVYKTFRTHCRR